MASELFSLSQEGNIRLESVIITPHYESVYHALPITKRRIGRWRHWHGRWPIHLRPSCKAGRNSFGIVSSPFGRHHSARRATWATDFGGLRLLGSVLNISEYNTPLVEPLCGSRNTVRGARKLASSSDLTSCRRSAIDPLPCC